MINNEEIDTAFDRSVQNVEVELEANSSASLFYFITDSPNGQDYEADTDNEQDCDWEKHKFLIPLMSKRYIVSCNPNLC